MCLAYETPRLPLPTAHNSTEMYARLQRPATTEFHVDNPTAAATDDEPDEPW